ncbi:hypothetical protein [Entomobacter blattae]|uniref:Uncharacterized protein n=1 Tax=Entomobacter blattae TaxID=2762277 RepID=A0A7H1NSQ1_9PROT|nr:hypothetical protein [Entomobacter blattae]QNT78811.1 hypothetical protein JGUZn3_15880 [Entomobacter blattae]
MFINNSKKSFFVNFLDWIEELWFLYPVMIGVIGGLLNAVQQSQKILFFSVKQDLNVSSIDMAVLFGVPNLCFGSISALILAFL